MPKSKSRRARPAAQRSARRTATPRQSRARQRPRRGRRSIENPSTPLSQAVDWLDGGAYFQSTSGVRVSPQRAMRLAAFWQAVFLLSGDIAKLPLEVFARHGADRAPDESHPAQRLVRWQANDEQTAFEFWLDFVAHLLVWRNAFARIMRDGNGMPTALIPLLPDRTAPEKINGQTYYVSEIDGTLQAFPAWEVLHVRGVSFGGRAGLDLIHFARDTLGKALIRQQTQSKFFKRGMRIGGILELPGGMPKPIQDKVESTFRSTYDNNDNAFATIALKDGAKFHAAQSSFRDAQLIEVANEDVREVARLFNCPPHKLGDTSRSNYNTLEQENRAYYDSTLGPWMANIKSVLWLRLLSRTCRTRGCHFFDYNVGALLWADVQSVATIGNAGIQSGWLVRDEVRRWFNLNGLPGGGGKIPLVPVNLAPDPNYKPSPNESGDDQQTAGGVTSIDDDGAIDPAPPPIDHDDGEPARSAPALRCSPAWFRNVPAPIGAESRTVGGQSLADVVGVLESDARRRFVRRLSIAASKAAKRSGGLAEWLAAEIDDHLPVGREMFAPVSAAARIAAPQSEPRDYAAEIVAAVRADGLAEPARCFERIAAGTSQQTPEPPE